MKLALAAANVTPIAFEDGLNVSVLRHCESLDLFTCSR
ncbi:hypothetical protein SLEP1_g690 [Rubroshorea leprosula]|uniref:Uncharacterized protein n=1 Tax=Rubroshorea leprosula TaxID=152421 RepID=A0AAV5HBG2_9ROSI|nr:hypothetical protein SLEP1_g690 [Rubroshorea leprosula]